MCIMYFMCRRLQPYKSDGRRHMPPPEIVDGELEYTIESVTAHRVSTVGGKRKNARRTRIEYLTCWEGYGREHDTWNPAEMLDNTEALEIYLQGLPLSLKRNYHLGCGIP